MSDSTPPPTDGLTAATQMVKNGRLEQARETLMQYLMQNPSSEQAWLLMSYVLSEPAKQKDCLERVLKINPNNTVAQSKLAHLLGRRTEELFKKKAQPSAPAASAPEAAPAPEPQPAATATPEPPPSEEGTEAVSPPAPSAEPGIAPEKVPASAKKNFFSGKWFRITTIILLILILVIAAVILYTGIIGPAINALSSTPTPTTAPVKILTLPPEWTQTLTPTKTPTRPPTETPPPTVALSETTIP